MQTQQEVESICYDAILAQAERHMQEVEGEPSPCGRCRDCAYCSWGIDHVDVGAPLADMLVDSVGICDYEMTPRIVELDSEHDEGCWEEER